jgi:glutamate dehydrogenase (NAD(P)+)
MNQSANGILQTSLFNFERATKRLDLDKGMSRKILGPKERTEVNINPVLPDGRMIAVKAFVVVHNDALGPAKGGIRMTPDVTLDDINGLAMEMTWKTAIIGVPFGGGKSGIRFDPNSATPDAKEVIVRCFTRGVRRNIGPELYVPAPDMGTNENDMAHIRDCIAYSQAISITKGCYVTGKPLILGGIAGRREATGRGVVHTVLAMCEKLGLEIGRMRVVVQGFGNVGSVAAADLARLGATVIGASDISGGVVNADGLDVSELLDYVEQTGAVKGFPNAKEIDRNAILDVECDILVPAAAGSQITKENAHQINTKIVAEGANAPTTPEADEILKQRDILVIPDILCNAGGVFVSYLEYAQETQREQMTLEEVEQRLAERMTQRFDAIHALAKEKGQTMRDAAMDMAVGRVVEAVHTRGLLP